MIVRALHLTRPTALLALAAALAALTGCAGLSPTTDTLSTTPAPAAKPHVHGTVFGGQQPIAGSTIQLYAVNTTTLQGASTPLIASTVLTDAYGGFDITGLYTCPANALVYIAAAGGNPGAGVNPAAVLIAGLGPCSALSASTFITLNELTTVATAFALQPFMADYQHTGATASQLTGITNAFNMIDVLVNIATGSSPGPVATSATVPVAELNSLADILAGCVNSNGTGDACMLLFYNSDPPSRGIPTDVTGAALGIAASPAFSVYYLYDLLPSDVPFNPTLPSAPNDWTVSLTLTGNGINGPHSIAIDAAGNAWVSNPGNSSVTKFSPTGAALSGPSAFTAGGLFGPQGIAIDLSGNAWIANTAADSVIELSSTGSPLSGTSGFTTGGIDAPIAIAIDKQSNAWVANFAGNSVTEISNTGVASGSSPLSLGGLLSAPTSIAIDPSGNIWATSGGNGTLVAFTAGGTVQTGAGITDGYLQGTAGLAIDSTGTAWAVQPGNNALTVIASNFAPSPIGSPDFVTGLSQPLDIAIDGGGNLWITNSNSSGGIAQLAAGTGTVISGFSNLGSLNTPIGLAIDGSGNIWTANSASDSVSIFLGMASPTTTPLVAQLP